MKRQSSIESVVLYYICVLAHMRACISTRGRYIARERRKRLSYRGSPVSLKTEYTTAVICSSMHTRWRSYSLSLSLSLPVPLCISLSLFLPHFILLCWYSQMVSYSFPTSPCQLDSRHSDRDKSYAYFLRLTIRTLLSFS